VLELLAKFRKWLPFTFDIDINVDVQQQNTKIDLLEQVVNQLQQQLNDLSKGGN